MRLYGSGDNGTTSDFNGRRIHKTDPSLAVIGELDILISLIGTRIGIIKQFELVYVLMSVQFYIFYNLCNGFTIYSTVVSLVCMWMLTFKFVHVERLSKVQENIFKINADISMSKTESITTTDISILEEELNSMMKKQPKLTRFIYPNDILHLIRGYTRKCELIVRDKYPDMKNTCVYLNRLSTYLFYLSREYVSDIEWKSG